MIAIAIPGTHTVARKAYTASLRFVQSCRVFQSSVAVSEGDHCINMTQLQWRAQLTPCHG